MMHLSFTLTKSINFSLTSHCDNNLHSLLVYDFGYLDSSFLPFILKYMYKGQSLMSLILNNDLNIHLKLNIIFLSLK